MKTKDMKKYSSVLTRELQIKTRLNHTYTPIIIVKMKKKTQPDNSNHWWS